jgi:putative ABC transport system substrate-binding protein
MRRRAFLVGLGAAGWAPMVRAQTPAKPVIGFLGSGTAGVRAYLKPALAQGLKESQYVAGRSIALEYRWAEGDYGRLPALAGELVRRGAAVIVSDGTEATVAVQRATDATPVVFIIGTDPVRVGLVRSLNRPGTNLTGFTMQNNQLVGKRVELLHELLPDARTIALLVNPEKDMERQTREPVAVARTLGLDLAVVQAGTEGGIAAVFARLAETGIRALVVHADPFLDSRREMLVALAARHRIAASYEWREFAEAGGLMSYGVNIADIYRQAGGYAGRILRGARAAELPVVQQTKYEFVINMKAAGALGIAIPPSIMVRADEVIE